MKTADFDYELPPELIAQHPVEPRDAARLMVLDRATGTVQHARFAELPGCLRPGDLLIFNDTRVLPARLPARKAGSRGRVELLLLKRQAPLTWEVMVGGHGVTAGSVLEVEGAPQVRAVVVECLDGPRRVVQFSEPISPVLERVGQMPLPPYIHAELADRERYQTVYSRVPGSAAAPTAGLHFTPALLDRLQAAGVQSDYVTLHVGLDTFAPVREADASEHAMHGEWCELRPETAERINAAKVEGRRVIAVGTTSVRTLESAAESARDGAAVSPYLGTTHLFILPGHPFRAVDAILTNFHLPRSTLLMLVAAFAGRERLLAAYAVARREGYRFYSFGDAMFIA